MTESSVVLSALEFDVAWESERLGERHVAIDVPSPGATHRERAELVAKAWDTMTQRGLAKGNRLIGEVADQLATLANYLLAIDVWVWEDRRISGIVASTGNHAQLAVLDEEELWLIPARDTALAESAVSVSGEAKAGRGRSVSVPEDLLFAADADADGDPERLITRLESRGVNLTDAQILAAMLDGMTRRGQFGAERREATGRINRADRVLSFHDTPSGRFLYTAQQSEDERWWATVTPADNQRIATSVWELLDELS